MTRHLSLIEACRNFEIAHLQFKQMTHISPGEEYRRPAYLEEVLAIFKRNSHPFVQVDSLAMRWMGSSNIPTLVSET